jgi:hypothetical protein
LAKGIIRPSRRCAAVTGYNEFLKAQQATCDDAGQPIPATFHFGAVF